jgi:hypothetical protein
MMRAQWRPAAGGALLAGALSLLLAPARRRAATPALPAASR